jgi:hypothetical protein
MRSRIRRTLLRLPRDSTGPRKARPVEATAETIVGSACVTVKTERGGLRHGLEIAKVWHTFQIDREDER